MQTTAHQTALNEVVVNKVQNMIANKAVGVQATMERLINEGNMPTTIEDITKQGYRFHHSAMRATYCPRKTPYTIRPYSGRFGTGYMVLYPNRRSNNYSPCDYYVQ